MLFGKVFRVCFSLLFLGLEDGGVLHTGIMGEELASLSISDDEEDLIQKKEDENGMEEDFRLCLVGRVLIESVIHFFSM